MVQITRPPMFFDYASDVVQEGFERARGAIDMVAERAGEAVDTIDGESLKSIGREFIGDLPTRQPDRSAPVQVARDGERLKSAAVAAVVIFITSLVVLFLAREVARRRASQRRQQREVNHPVPATTEG